MVRVIEFVVGKISGAFFCIAVYAIIAIFCYLYNSGKLCKMIKD